MALVLKRCRYSETRSFISVMITWLVMMPCDPSRADIVSAAREPKQSKKASIMIAPAQLANELKEPNLRVLDTRSEDAYAKGHVPGAMRVDVNDWKTLATTSVEGGRGLHNKTAWSEKVGRLGITQTSRVVVYGDQLPDTARIWWLLKYLGIENAAIVDGGWQWWVQDGRPVETSAPKVAPTAFKPNLQFDRLEEIDRLKKSVRASRVQVVDARSADEFTGKDVRGKRGGHITGAAHLEWKELLAKDGRFKTREQLQALFRERGILPDETAVCY